ncbi:MAG: hypothetical protein R2715_06945, partial [Ilumatobacteraceae bacterium]
KQLSVLLDVGAASHTPESFERAISAATSIVVSAAHEERPIRFFTSAGFEHSTGTVGLDLLLEHLALLDPVSEATLDVVIGQLNTRVDGGLLIVVGGAISPGMAAAVRRTPAADAVVLVACADPAPAPGPGAFVVDATVDDVFPTAWRLLVGVSDGSGGVDHRAARPEGRIVLGGATR